MSPKPIVVTVMTILALVLVLLPMIEANRNTSQGEQGTPSMGMVDTVQLAQAIADNRQSASAVDKPVSLFPPLSVQATATDRGFQLQFDREQYPVHIGTVSNSSHIFHAYARHDYKEDGSGDAWTSYDAVVVNPETLEVKVYPLYELRTLLTGGDSLFTLIDERNVMFIRPMLDGNLLKYDLVRLDMETGQIAVIAPCFWEMSLKDEAGTEDFILSAHYSNRSNGYGNLLLTSFKGRVWHIDVASGEVRTNGEEVFPAYGDPGSKPPRELVYPSPDLTRFVYQHWENNQFEVIDSKNDKAIRQFGFEDTIALMDPGIVWSPDNRLFFMEYGNRDQAIGAYTDNGLLLFAQGIRFYDQDGKVIQTLELPPSKERRMNVYGWADEGKVWIEYFRAIHVDEGEPLKQEITYKLYDIRKGTFTDYDTTGDLSGMQNSSVIKMHGGYSFRSLPFIMADSAKRLLWLPPSDATNLRASGESRYGTLRIKSQPGELRLIEGGGPYYYGTYRVEYTNPQGDKQVLQPLVDLAMHQESSPSVMRQFEFDGYDVLLFQPNSFRFSKGFDGGARQVMAYAVTKQGEAFPLSFQYARDTKQLHTSFLLPIDDNVPVERDGENLVVQALMSNRNYELRMKPSLDKRTLTVIDAADRTAETELLTKITNRYANRLEQALGLEDIDLPEGKMDDKQLRALFTDQAWNNPGFQHLRMDFAESKQKGNSSRAFAWSPIDARLVSPDTIRFTFTLNLWYAIGLAAHLEVGLKLVDGIWTFHDLGTLETEKLEGLPGYNGLLIRDPLELTG